MSFGWYTYKIYMILKRIYEFCIQRIESEWILFMRTVRILEPWLSLGIGHGLLVKALAKPAARARESVHLASNTHSRYRELFITW